MANTKKKRSAEEDVKLVRDNNGESRMSGRDRERDDEGRFMSDEDDDRSYRGGSSRGRSSQGRGWYGDSEGHARAGRMSHQNDYEDESDEGDYGSYNNRRSGRYGGQRGGRSERDYDEDRYYGRGQSRPRDEEGRFMSDEERYGSRRGMSRRDWDEDSDRYYSSRGSRGQGQYRRRDEEGRFMGDEDDYRSSRRGYSSRSSSGQGRGWYGDPEGHARAGRMSHQNDYESESDEDDYDQDMRSNRSSRGGRRMASGGGRGWFGDPQGHARAGRHSHDND
jgi:hypothetical protein